MGADQRNHQIASGLPPGSSREACGVVRQACRTPLCSSTSKRRGNTCNVSGTCALRPRPKVVLACLMCATAARQSFSRLCGTLAVADAPTPYTPHLTPYTLHLIPYTLYLTPHTLHPTPSRRTAARHTVDYQVPNFPESGGYVTEYVPGQP